MDSMHLYKRGATWWLRFRDHKGHGRRLRAMKDRRVSEALARRVGELVDRAATGNGLGEDLAAWVVHNLDDARKSRIIAWGLVDAACLAGGERLEKQIETWAQGIRNRGRGDRYADLRETRASKLLLEACGFVYLRDIEAERVMTQVAEWKRAQDAMGRRIYADYTLAHYLSAAKGFTRWAMRSGRTGRDALAVLPVSRGEPKRRRRALNQDEQIRLVQRTAEAGIVRCGMTAVERALLYRVALQTGLRAGAIARLTAGDIDPGHGLLNAQGSGASNKRSSPKPLPRRLLQDLLAHAAMKSPATPLFGLPSSTRLARTLRADLEAAGISSTGVDFHALRHTFGTSMARAGVHAKTLMSLMDHGTIQMTMRYYTHSLPEDEAAAVARLPDLMGCDPAVEAAT